MKILVTGAAGFIGFHTSRRLLDRGEEVTGVDNLSPYYDVALKESRLARLQPYDGFCFQRLDVADRSAMERLFAENHFSAVVHLAAQAGVRYSLTNPHAYVDANLVGFVNVLEGCRHGNVGHLVYASSSSVYGANKKIPFSTEDNVDHPISLYAATKKANELMAFTYSHLYRIPTTGLRFFTVYGPWGRPDMAVFKFTEAILQGAPIPVYNYGRMKRDFTYIDDIVEGVTRIVDSPPTCAGVDRTSECECTLNSVPYQIFNIGNHQPVELLRFIGILEDALGKEADKQLLPPQPGDVPETYAEVTELEEAIGFRPATSLELGLRRFVDWYRDYYQV